MFLGFRVSIEIDTFVFNENYVFVMVVVCFNMDHFEQHCSAYKWQYCVCICYPLLLSTPGIPFHNYFFCL